MGRPRGVLVSAGISRAVMRTIALCVLAIAAAQLPPVSHAAQRAPTLQLSAPAQVDVNGSIMITLGVAGAANLAGYEATLLFDTRAAEFAGLSQRDNDLAKLGRGVGSLNVAEQAYGTAIGLYSCPSASCVDGADPRQPNGASGNVRLATIELI